MNIAKMLTACAVSGALALASCGKTVATDGNVDIIPLPEKVVVGEDVFLLKPTTSVVLFFNPENIDYAVDFWRDVMKETLDITTFNIIDGNTVGSTKRNAVNIWEDKTMGDEQYRLEVRPHHIDIYASKANGVFYAFQTLRQMLPVEAFDSEDGRRIEIPVCTVEDKPYFAYRGFMFDMGRHIFGVQDLKETLDILAMHKINKFHWHLTDDQGWRIEIKKYPKLTEIGSVRKSSPVGRNEGQDGKPYGGYFTQDEVRDVVKYAAERFITVIPEIEIPGHSVAALAAYPELGCTGEQYEVLTWWGIDERVICPGKEQSFTFLEDVLTEVMDLFPSEYIHIGGDECPKTVWHKCPDCRKRMKAEGLKNEAELQSYVTARVEKFLNDHGRKIIGWDEILEGGVTPSATVMAWRGPQYGIKAAKQGNHVIMAPNTHCYLDYYQSRDTKDEPLAIGGYLPLEKTYSLDPYDKLNDAERKYILGVQGNLWTEYISEYDHAQYMALPRLSAIAEVGWSYPNKDYDSFVKRLHHLAELFDHYGYNYGKHALTDANAEKTE